MSSNTLRRHSRLTNRKTKKYQNNSRNIYSLMKMKPNKINRKQIRQSVCKDNSFCPKLTETQYKMLYLIKQLEKIPNYYNIVHKYPKKWKKIQELYKKIIKLDYKNDNYKTIQDKYEIEIISVLEFFTKKIM